MKKRIFILISISLAVLIYFKHGETIYLKLSGKRTISEVIDLYEQPTEEFLKPLFTAKGISYPPEKMAFLVFKKERILELWASANKNYTKITQFHLAGYSGRLGPKLREGDKQIPEGIYKIIGFNPNSNFHLSMKLNYPNSFEVSMAEEEGRTDLGSDIFIHGNNVTIGCLAMGDAVIEILFTVSYLTGKDNIEVIIAPTDPRNGTFGITEDMPVWTKTLYRYINNKITLIVNNEYD